MSKQLTGTTGGKHAGASFTYPHFDSVADSLAFYESNPDETAAERSADAHLTRIINASVKIAARNTAALKAQSGGLGLRAIGKALRALPKSQQKAKLEQMAELLDMSTEALSEMLESDSRAA